MLFLPLKENCELPLNQAGPECWWFIQLKMSLLIDEIASYSAVPTPLSMNTAVPPTLTEPRRREKISPCMSTTAVFGASIIMTADLGTRCFLSSISSAATRSASSLLWHLQMPTCQHGRRGDSQISQAAPARSSWGKPWASQDARNKGKPQVEAGFHGLRGV